MSQRFNINHHVRVRLTDRGRSHLARIGREAKEEWQLWDLMHTFGPVLSNGMPIPFETEIELLGDPWLTPAEPISTD
jgi:hypothetical protein